MGSLWSVETAGFIRWNKWAPGKIPISAGGDKGRGRDINFQTGKGVFLYRFWDNGIVKVK